MTVSRISAAHCKSDLLLSSFPKILVFQSYVEDSCLCLKVHLLNKTYRIYFQFEQATDVGQNSTNGIASVQCMNNVALRALHI